MRRWFMVLGLLLLWGCNAPAPPPAEPEPAPPAVVAQPTPPPPAVPAEAPPKSALEADLDGDGRPDKVFLAKGSIRVVAGTGIELLRFESPELMASMSAQVHPLAGRPPLLHVSWPACPRIYPDNLFAWFDPAAGRMVTDREPGAIMGRCGVYEYAGDGILDMVNRHEEFNTRARVRWTEGGLVWERLAVELLPVQLDRLPVVLSILADTDVANPEQLFEPADLYRQFRLKVRPDSRFELHGAPSTDTIVVDIAHGGTLTATYRAQGEFKQNVLITGLKWAP